jgi:hypothetical protein
MDIDENTARNKAEHNSFECNGLLTKKVEKAAKALWEAECKPSMKRAGYSVKWKDQPMVIKVGNRRKAQIVLKAYRS